MQVDNILIVGGGSAGWMTAAAITKRLPRIKVTVLESSKIGTVGVGESTLGHINKFLDILGLKDEDWMAECNATYKTSIKFTDFRKKGTYFHYPFGTQYTENKPGKHMDWWHLNSTDPVKVPFETYAEYYHDAVTMTDMNRMTRNDDGLLLNFDFKYDTAYHMDAERFGQFLKNSICMPGGVTHIDDLMTSVNQSEDGAISGIVTENHGTLTSDLYIDCTGFRAMLIDKVMKSPFHSFDYCLMNDRAMAMRVPYLTEDEPISSVTNCTAIQNGWVWDIPLYHRIGTGYVYSSKFASQDQAETEFRQHLGKRDPRILQGDGEINHIKIRHGIHERPWIKNCVAIGLACGFIEPLESTGLLTTHENIIRLLDTLHRRDGYVNQFDIDGWTFFVRDSMESFRQFVSMHYGLSQRDDTPYWHHVTHNIVYDERVATLTSFHSHRSNIMELHANLNITNDTMPAINGNLYIMAGMGLNPVTPQVQTIIKESQRTYPDVMTAWDAWSSRKAILQKEIAELPTHREFLKQTIYGGR